MKIKKYLGMMLLVLLSAVASAQAPSNDSLVHAIPMCPNVSYEGSNRGATVGEIFDIDMVPYNNACFDSVTNTVWFKFRTNFDGGHVQIRFSNVSCLLAPNKGDSIEAAIVNPFYDQNDPQDAYLVSGCSQGGASEDFVLSSAFPLDPLTEYYVVIDGLQPTLGSEPIQGSEYSECDFELIIFGEGSDLTIRTVPQNASRTLIKGERVLCVAEGADSNPDNVAWTPTDEDIIENPNSKTTYVFPKDESTVYRVVSANPFISDTTICFLKDSIVFYVNEELTPYNTFTPNADGVNDTWKIPQIDQKDEFDEATVTVYNRWGQQVYIKTGYRNDDGWDGKMNGQDLPEATYYWVIELNDQFNNARKFTGSVTIIR